MSRWDLIGTAGWFVITALAAVSLGFGVLGLLRRLLPESSPDEDHGVEQLGLSLMVGLGTLGCLATFAALFGLLSKGTLILIGLASLGVSLPRLASFRRRLQARIAEPSPRRRLDPVVGPLLICAAFIAASLYLRAMQPPNASDELHYHFPQAELVAQSGRLVMPLGGHPYYGNIPKLMEVIFASGIVVAGYSFAHTLHLAFALGFVLFVGGFVTRHCGARSGSLAALGILLYGDYTWNATVGFVDAAATSVEVAGLLLALNWVVLRRDRSLTAAAALIGIALGIKYTPLPTALFVTVAVVISTLRAKPRTFRPVLVFAGVAAVFGGYWYVRNLLVFGNPVYPFYFGHPGLSDLAYQGILADLHQFGPRTLGHFLGTPLRLYFESGVLPATAVLLAPFAVRTEPRRLHLALLGYGGAYSLYWFFVATHQTRFLMPAILVAVMLSAIAAARSPWLLAVVLAAVLSLSSVRNGAREMRYGLGVETRSEFLTHQFGCQYAVVEYLDQQVPDGVVIDNWSVWHAPSVAFYAKKHVFQRFSFPLAARGPNALSDAVYHARIRFVYFDTLVKARHLANPDPEIAAGRPERAAVEDILVRNSNLTFSTGACRLYQIDSARLASTPGH